ncbi:MAG: ASCH domain-containing protein [Candidatus Bathyarchaeota archaeon]|nr:ASCH domain-containing protein [Candidatus Bathyarchaeota archaeon]
MLFFNRHHLRLIVEGKKTATRRRKGRFKNGAVVGIRHWMFEKSLAKIRILRKYQQPLGAMTEEDANKEGGYTLKQFREVWREISGSWEPAQVVWVYEFELVAGSHVKRPEHCHLCGSWKVFPHNFGLSDCEDCGAIYNGQGELVIPQLPLVLQATA